MVYSGLCVFVNKYELSWTHLFACACVCLRATLELLVGCVSTPRAVCSVFCFLVWMYTCLLHLAAYICQCVFVCVCMRMHVRVCRCMCGCLSDWLVTKLPYLPLYKCLFPGPSSTVTPQGKLKELLWNVWTFYGLNWCCYMLLYEVLVLKFLTSCYLDRWLIFCDWL